VLDFLGLASTDLSAQILNNHDPSQKVLDELVTSTGNSCDISGE